MKNPSRRQFLARGAQTLAGAGLALGANPWLTLAHAADGSLDTAGDYRALVCVYLQGGCDGFSLLVPSSSSEYAEYAGSRQQLAVPRSQLLDLASLSGTGPAVGLHPAAAALRPLYESGHLAMIANVGNLVEPTTRAQYEERAVQLPAQLFSHADQEIQWQQLQSADRSTRGWGALAASQLSGYTQRDYLTSITLDGANYWQAGAGQRPFSIRASGIETYPGMEHGNDWHQPRRDAFRRLLDASNDHVLQRAYRDLQKRAWNITAELGAVLVDSVLPETPMPADNPLAERLAMVAELIGAREQLGMQRQIFYVQMDGFDVHDNQSREQPELFRQLAEAMAYFNAVLGELGVQENTTTFTASDFGRTLTSNGDGTDHGWGSHLMVMGGAVRGGEIYGRMPSMHVDGPDAIHNGRIVPTLSANEYAATLLAWLGLDDAQLDEVLPNLANFTRRDIGFMTG